MPVRPTGGSSILIRRLDEISELLLGAVGGKAVGLGRLVAAGLPVPPGFCLTTEAYRLHVGNPAVAACLEEALHEGGEPPSATELAALRAAIAETPLAAEVAEALARAWEELRRTGPDAVAVRSSGTAEDLSEQSFAGQHETVLNVLDLEGCTRAVRRCWASLWSDAAVAYRDRAAVEHRSAAMAVVVQAFVNADTSGVLFTVDPVSGRRDRIVIEAVEGQGEALVSGRATPDRIVLASAGLRILERTAAGPTLALVPADEGGLVEREAGAAGKDLALDDDDARRLAALALEAKAALGRELDIEWAATSGKMLLLQARPVTAIAAERRWEDRQVWTNLNAGEVLPDVATPMTWGIVRPLAERLIGSFVSGVGVDLEGAPLVGLVAGRAYFNLNTLYGFVRRVPFMDRRALASFFGGEARGEAGAALPDIPEEDVPELGFSLLKMMRRLPAFVVALLTFSERRGLRVVERLRGEADAVANLNLDPLSEEELLALGEKTRRTVLEAEDAFAVAGAANALPSILYDVCGRYFGDGGNAAASQLLAGLGTAETANAGLDLWGLSRLARTDPELEKAIVAAPRWPDLRLLLERSAAGVRFLQEWHRFMARHGHHCRAEIELANPRWSEEPDEVLTQLRASLQGDTVHDLGRTYDGLAERRSRVEAECRGALRNPLRRWHFNLVLKKARVAAPFRENVKSQLIRLLGAFRRILLELGRRWTRAGRVGEPSDVFFLEPPELAPGGPAGTLRRQLAERRAEWERNKALDPPPLVFGQYDPALHAPETENQNVRILKGIPCNPGVVTDRARVITAAGADHVRPGEVLVAPFTDPGWTPFFINAAAIVMDQGGVLSHGSIVARELGIPAVVNVGHGTKIISTGQLVRVDGARGIVEILDE